VNDPDRNPFGCLSQPDGTAYSTVASANGDMPKVIRNKVTIVVSHGQCARKWIKVNDHIATLCALSDIG
jgi:hypothetical protein